MLGSNNPDSVWEECYVSFEYLGIKINLVVYLFMYWFELKNTGDNKFRIFSEMDSSERTRTTCDSSVLRGTES